MRLGMNMTNYNIWVHHKKEQNIGVPRNIGTSPKKQQNIGVPQKQQKSGQSQKYAIYRYITKNNRISVFHKNDKHRDIHKMSQNSAHSNK